MNTKRKRKENQKDITIVYKVFLKGPFHPRIYFTVHFNGEVAFEKYDTAVDSVNSLVLLQSLNLNQLEIRNNFKRFLSL